MTLTSFGDDAFVFVRGVECARARGLGRRGRGAARARGGVGDGDARGVVVGVVGVVDARGGHHGREHWIGL